MRHALFLASLITLAMASSQASAQSATPGFHSPVQYAAAPMTTAYAPYAGQVNHAHTSQSFRWGWFGAEHVYPAVQQQRTYYGDWLSSSRQRRY